MSNVETWYVVKQENGQCVIVAAQEESQNHPSTTDRWGPYASEEEAIARRVGLIRAGKCRPV